MRSAGLLKVRYVALLYGITLVGAAGLYLHLQHEIMHRTYRLHALEKEQKQIIRELNELRDQLQEYQQPDAVRRAARRLGLQTPAPHQYIHLIDDGSCV